MTSAESEQHLSEAVREALAGVIDPELGIDVLALGLVYGIWASGEGVLVEMTATSPACPMNDYLVAEAQRRIRQRLHGEVPVEVRLVWDPPWSPDRMTPEARRLLGMEEDGA
ncbi:MAG: metal-sulfur cluster assembly factor [Gammaproteobacteria bacterium]|nr:MAG: metal-sulfur cluster assembly factor [Gammaproteobacteria bacterium]